MKHSTNMRFIFLLLLLIPTLSFADCKPSADSCDFYRCKEKEQTCGPSGYWQNFGDPYCRKFLNNEKSFSKNSQIWLKDVRECLQVRVGEVSDQVSCKQLFHEAMDSHISCYVDTGFCSLSLLEKWKIFWYLKGAASNPLTWKEAALLSQACRTRGYLIPE